MSFTEITKGNFRGLGAGSITTKDPQLQPNYSIEFDGYGLITGRATFTCTASAAPFRTPKRGDVFPGREKRLYCHRAGYTITGNNLATITAEYCGIESGNATKIILRGDTGAASESIKVHKDFKTILQPKGWSKEKQAFVEGENGTLSDADKFKLTGIKSYLRPAIQLQGTFYTSDKSLISYYIASVGKTFSQIKDVDFSIYYGSFQTDDPEFFVQPGMVTNVSHEEFGNLYKVNVSFRIAQGGWHKLIYKSANTK